MSCVMTKRAHVLIEITSYARCGDIHTVRWCRDCGSVVIDVDADGRVYPGEERPMLFPQIALEAEK